MASRQGSTQSARSGLHAAGVKVNSRGATPTETWRWLVMTLKGQRIFDPFRVGKVIGFMSTVGGAHGY